MRLRADLADSSIWMPDLLITEGKSFSCPFILLGENAAIGENYFNMGIIFQASVFKLFLDFKKSICPCQELYLDFLLFKLPESVGVFQVPNQDVLAAEKLLKS
jgi:hypothetical protein